MGKVFTPSEINLPPYYYAGLRGTSGALKYFFRRGLALLYDYLLVAPLIVCGLSVYAHIINSFDFNIWIMWSLVVAPVQWAYFTLFEYLFEFTPGKYFTHVIFNTSPIVGFLWVVFVPLVCCAGIYMPPWQGVVTVVLYVCVLAYLTKKTYKVGGKPKYLLVISTDKRRIKFWQAAVRNLGRVLPIASLDYSFAFFTKRKQRLFDILAKTVVIPGEALAWQTYSKQPPVEENI